MSDPEEVLGQPADRYAMPYRRAARQWMEAELIQLRLAAWQRRQSPAPPDLRAGLICGPDGTNAWNGLRPRRNSDSIYSRCRFIFVSPCDRTDHGRLTLHWARGVSKGLETSLAELFGTLWFVYTHVT